MGMTLLTQDYLDRFGGVARLVGMGGLEKLHAAHVCVIGVGGVGSWTVEGLARSGVGAITLIDLDDVCVTNVNRQLPALDGTVGRPKVAVLAERVRLINPSCRVDVRTEFFTKESAERLLGSGAGGFDVVVDAIDGMTQKALLIAECVRRGLKCVTVGGAGGKRDATLVRVGDLGDSHGDGLLRLVRKKLRRDHGFAGGKGNHYGVRCVSSAEHPVYPWSNGTCSTEQEPGSSLTLDCATGFGTAVWVTAAFGFAAAQEAVGLVTGAVRAGEMTSDQ
jgi:tRNA A37 threonylcarbamoyladenosine dehydratase